MSVFFVNILLAIHHILFMLDLLLAFLFLFFVIVISMGFSWLALCFNLRDQGFKEAIITIFVVVYFFIWVISSWIRLELWMEI